jgi:hypothetical protein
MLRTRPYVTKDEMKQSDEDYNKKCNNEVIENSVARNHGVG